MKIATYNLRLGGKASQRIHWNEIFEVIDPDIFLVQETCHPKMYITTQLYDTYRDRIHWVKAGKNNWGSAVFVRSGKIKPIVIPEFAGYVVGVRVDGCKWSKITGRSLLVFSLHAPAPYKRSIKLLSDMLAG